MFRSRVSILLKVGGGIVGVGKHVANCPRCKPKFERMGGVKMFGRAAIGHRPSTA